MKFIATYGLYLITAICEIAGCYLFMRFSRDVHNFIYLLASIIVLLIFAWLLTFHDEASGRVYAAYGGVYIVVSISWLWLFDGIRPNMWDASGALIALAGVSLIIFQPK